MKSTPASRRLAKSLSRKLPVGRSTEMHKSPLDYDRRNNKDAIEQELAEMECEMEEDVGLHDLVMEVFTHLVGKGVDATRYVEYPPVIGVRRETGVFKITIERADKKGVEDERLYSGKESCTRDS